MDRIYVVTDRQAAGDRFWEIIASIMRRGYRFIQLREKDLSSGELYAMGERIMKMDGAVKLVINDRVDVACALGAYGVQLTERSLAPDIAATVKGRLKIGVSVHDCGRVTLYEKYADFFVFGNVFETASKPGVAGKGVCALREAAMLTTKPVFAIGGINHANARVVLKSGAWGVALKGGVFTSDNPCAELDGIKHGVLNNAA